MKLHASAQGYEILQKHLPMIMSSCSVIKDDEKLDRLDTTARSREVTQRFSERMLVTDVVSVHGPIVKVSRRWFISKPGRYRFCNTFSYEDDGRPNEVMIPAIWYRDNEHGLGMYPNKERAEYWAFKENRMPVPGCIQLSNGRHVFSCSLNPCENKEHMASSSWDTHGVRVTIPGKEWPYSYRGKTALVETSSEPNPYLDIAGPTIYEREFWLFLEKNNDPLIGYRNYVQALRAMVGKPQASYCCSWKEYQASKIHRILQLVNCSEDGLAYVKMGEGNAEVQPVYEFTSASFLVKSLEAATSLAQLGSDAVDVSDIERLRAMFSLKPGQDVILQVARRIGQFFLKAESAPGVFRDCYDLELEYFGGYLGIGEHQEYKDLVNSRCNGEAMKQYVLLYRALKQRGDDVSQFLDIAKRVAAFYCDNQLSTGSFGRWWTPTGMPVDTNGTNGAYIGSFLVTLVAELEDGILKERVLSAIAKGYQYYAQLAEEGSFYGDTLDADSCDKEAGLALLGFFLDLYEYCPDERYLASAINAANFVMLWIWQVDQNFPIASQLGEQGFRTTGLTSVSVAHHHMDFYGMTIAYDFLRLSEISGDQFFHDQALLMLNACRQLVSTEDNLLGRSEAFVGWQPEQINYTDWDYFDDPQHFCGSFFIDIAWVNVLGLGAFQRISKRYSAVLEGWSHE